MHNWLLHLLTINSQYSQQIHFVPKYSVWFPFTHMLQDSCKARNCRTGHLWYPWDRQGSLPVCLGTRSSVTHYRCGASGEQLLGQNERFQTTHATFLQVIHRGRKDLIEYRTLIKIHRKKGWWGNVFIDHSDAGKRTGYKLS